MADDVEGGNAYANATDEDPTQGLLDDHTEDPAPMTASEAKATSQPPVPLSDAIMKFIPDRHRALCRRLVQLVLISLLTVGNQIAYDSIGAGEVFLKKRLKLSAEAVGDLYSMYHLPNTFIVAIGGRLSDRMGAANAAVLFSAAVVCGAVIVAVGAHSSSIGIMSLGRICLGVGGESLAVAQLALLSRAFGKNNPSRLFPTMAVSFALALMVQRVGSLVAFLLLPGQFHLLGVGAFWVVAIICMVVLAVACLYAVSYPVAGTGADAGTVAGDPSQPWYSRAWSSPLNPFRSLGTVWGSNSLFFSMMFLVTWSAMLIPFVDFATDLFNERFNYGPERASRTTSIVTVMSILLTTPFGLIVDHTQVYGAMLCAGAITALPAFYMLVATPDMPPEFSCVLIGVASAVVSATLWPAVSAFIKSAGSTAETESGAIIGLLIAVQNWALCLGPLLVGELRDASGGFTSVLSLFLALNVACILLAAILWGFAPPRAPAGESEGASVGANSPTQPGGKKET